MKIKRSARSGLLVVSTAMLAGTSARGESMGDGSAMYGAIAGELARVLAGSKRLAALPNNIQSILVAPKHPPIFSMWSTDRAAGADLATALASAQKAREGFRAVFEGQAIGANPRGEVVVVSRDRRAGVVVGGQTPRRVYLGHGIRMDRAFFVNGTWVFQTSSGLIAEDGTVLWGDTDDGLRGSTIVADDRRLVIVKPVPMPDNRKTCTVVIGCCDGRKTEKRSYAGVPLRSVKGIARCQDGRWLLIGSKLAFLRHDLKPGPSEEDLAAALKAAEEERNRELLSAMEELTLYPAKQLTGLASLLREQPDQTTQARELQKMLKSMLEDLDRIEQPVSKPGEEPQRTGLPALINTYRTQTERALVQLSDIVAEQSGTTPKGIAARIAGGYQYFDGWWIRNPRVLLQESTGSALVCLQYSEGTAVLGRTGIFSVGPDGHLKLVCVLADRPIYATETPRVVRDREGQLLVFIAGRGLGRAESGKLVWVDQTAKLKAMSDVVGCDAEGRAYFSKGPRRPGSPLDIWVYHPGGSVSEPVKPLTFRVRREPVVDSLGRLWFIHQPSSRTHRWPRGPGDDSGLLEKALQRDYAFAEGTKPSGFQRVGGSGSRSAGLYCYDAGKLHRYFTHRTLSSASIYAGCDGAVLLSSRPVCLIEDEVVYAAPDFHRLAERHFDVLLRAAPLRIGPPRRLMPGGARGLASVLRAGEILWVCDSSRVEGYKDGRALLLNKRLILLGAKLRAPTLVGPLGQGEAKKILIVCEPGRMSATFWATQTRKGIALDKARTPPSYAADVRMMGHFDEFRGPPLVDYPRGRVHYYSYSDLVWEASGADRYELLQNAGKPVLLTRDGKLIVRPPGEAARGYRVISKTGQRDLALTYVKKLVPVSEEKDGRILCVCSEGVAWLKEDAGGAYAVDSVLELVLTGESPKYVGRAGNSLVFTTTDRGATTMSIFPVSGPRQSGPAPNRGPARSPATQP